MKYHFLSFLFIVAELAALPLKELPAIRGAAFGKEKIMVVLDADLATKPAVQSAVIRYAEDMQAAFGMAVQVQDFPTPAQGGTPAQLKQILQSSQDSLRGAIFIGDIPRAQFEFIQFNQIAAGVHRYQRWQTDMYYMDLDGVWYDTAAGWAGSKGGIAMQRIDASPNHDWGWLAPDPTVPKDSFSVRWTGWMQAPVSGLCSLKVVSDNQRRIWLDDSLVIDAWIIDWGTPYYGAITLEAGQPASVRIDYAEEAGGASFLLYWKLPNSTDWTLVPDSVWKTSQGEAGLEATYFANIWLRDGTNAHDYLGSVTDWKSNTSNGVFDGHYSTRNQVSDSMEIWISRIDPATAGILGDPTTLLLDWFEKVHVWYQQKKQPQTKGIFFITADADTTKDSDRKFMTGHSTLYGRENLTIKLADSREYMNTISDTQYGWSTYVGHGTTLGLANGLSATSLRAFPVGPRIFHFASCSPHESYDMFGFAYSVSLGAAHLFGTTGGGFVSVGSTKVTGGNQFDDDMYFAAINAPMGAAFLEWVNLRIFKNDYWPRQNIYDWFYGMSLLGDPMQTATRTPEYPSTTDNSLLAPTQHPVPQKSTWTDAAGRSLSHSTTKYKARYPSTKPH